MIDLESFNCWYNSDRLDLRFGNHAELFLETKCCLLLGLFGTGRTFTGGPSSESTVEWHDAIKDRTVL